MPVTKKSKEEESPPPIQGPPPKEKTELELLRDQMKALTEKMERLGSKPKPTTDCAYCKSNSHFLREYFKRPHSGSCFDCRRPSCRRRDPICPEKQTRQSWGSAGNTLPIIAVAVNGHVLQRVDTSSSCTLLRHSTAVRVNWEIEERRTLLDVKGVTGTPHRVLGMVFLPLMARQSKVVKLWFPVVPDNNLSNDLLGCDVLYQATLT